MAFGAVIKKIQHVTAEETGTTLISSKALVGGGTDFDSVADVEKTELKMQAVSACGTPTYTGRGTTAVATMTATNAITVYWSSISAGQKVRWCLQIIEFY